MQVLCDENGYVVSFAMVGALTDGVEIPEPEDVSYFREHFQAYRLIDGELTFDESKEDALAADGKADAIRQRREAECFPIINRGQLWYEMLTDNQKAELKTWYQAWLDATETGVIPEEPVWL